jgi:hypothetical protein
MGFKIFKSMEKAEIQFIFNNFEYAIWSVVGLKGHANWGEGRWGGSAH